MQKKIVILAVSQCLLALFSILVGLVTGEGLFVYLGIAVTAVLGVAAAKYAVQDIACPLQKLVQQIEQLS